jgi:tRNA(Ile)-lysidine synthase
MDITKTISIAPGHYVVAVSGGVDSVALLHMLQDMPDVKLTVAHYDHGIRPDSHLDRINVANLAKKYGLPFVYNEGNLGPDASEELARLARYNFLRQTQNELGANAVITAHQPPIT